MAVNQRTQLTLTNGTKQDFEKFGTGSFIIAGTNHTVEIFRDNNLAEMNEHRGQLFVPFKDGTSGDTTSESGRYISIENPGDGDVIELDFNKAYNTYHAYNRSLISVLAPKANVFRSNLPVGQRKFEDRL